MKQKIYAFVIIFIFLTLVLGFEIVHAQNATDGVSVQALCPASVQTGESVTIGLQINKDPWFPTTTVINKSALAALFPNGSILGPFTTPINLSINPGQVSNVPNYMTFKMPATTPANTVVGVSVMLCSNGFEDCAVGGCAIEVKP